MRPGRCSRAARWAPFVETYARTCRKYGGALATATQSLNDYYKSDGATAALENSDWMLILQQKPETIADFRKFEAASTWTTAPRPCIRSLKREGSAYSEVFIKGPEVEAIGRLVLDPYSATLFSSSPQTGRMRSMPRSRAATSSLTPSRGSHCRIRPEAGSLRHLNQGPIPCRSISDRPSTRPAGSEENAQVTAPAHDRRHRADAALPPDYGGDLADLW
jgi:hypothetical protein